MTKPTVYYSVLDDKPATTVLQDTRVSRRRSLGAPDKTGKCFYCSCVVYPRGSTSALEFPDQIATNDHYTPYSIGAGIHPVKIVIACARCNNVKGNTPPHVFECFIRKTDTRVGSHALRSKYQHFTYLLMAAGLKAAEADAVRTHSAFLPPIVPSAPPRDPRGRFTIKDLRRRA